MTAPLPIGLPANVLEKAVGDGPSTQSPPTTWETLMEFQAPALGLAGPGCCGHSR